MTKRAPAFSVQILILALFIAPVLAGLAGTVLPAFGYLPALGGNAFSLGAFAGLFDQPGLLRSAIQTFSIGLVSTFGALFIVAAFFAGWSRTRVFAAIRRFLSPILSVPHAAAAFGFAFMVMPSGFVARLFSPWATGWQRPPDLLIVNDPMGLALIAGLIVKEIPFLFLVALAASGQVAIARNEQIARSFGYGRMAGFFLTSWPQIYRQIRLPIFAVIAYASANVDMAAILGPTLPQILPVRLALWMNDPDLSLRFMACAGALLQIAITLAAIGVWIAGEKIFGSVLLNEGKSGRRFRRDFPMRIISAIMMVAANLLVISGLAVLALWSVAGLWQFPDIWPDAITVRNWQQTLPRVMDPLLRSVLLGVVSTALAVGLTIALLHKAQREQGRRIARILYLPLIIPQIGFLFGLQVMAILFRIDGSFASLTLAHLLFVLPYTYLALSGPWAALDPRYETIASSFGKSQLAILFRIRLPMLLRPILTASAIGFAVSIGQYLATLLIASGRYSTITTEAVALGSGGNGRIIGIYAVLQMALPLAAFLIAALIPALIFKDRRAMSHA